MRVVGLVVAVALGAGCSDSNGTYIVLEGAKDFDRVEVYFGTFAGRSSPLTPLRATRIDDTQLLVQRTLAPPDMAAPDGSGLARTWSYFLPASDLNVDLGDYMLALALAGDTPVAVGELFQFEVPSDGLYRYIVPLVDVASEDVERWGRPTLDCIRWTRDRAEGPHTITVVRRDDSDCDSFRDREDRPGDPDAITDCEPLAYCDGSGSGGCVSTSSVCDVVSSESCTLGSCTNRDGMAPMCEPLTCIEPTLCTGCPSTEPEVLVQCAVDQIGVHEDYPIALRGDLSLCTNPYALTVDLPFPCTSPSVEAALNWMDGATFMFDVDPAAEPNQCILRITAPSNTARFDTVPHILLSVENPVGSTYKRSQFIFGLEHDPQQTCPGIGIAVQPSLGDCGPDPIPMPLP